MNALIIANTQIRRDADDRFCLNDLHQASGADKRNQPANWLRMDKTEELIMEIEREDDTVPHIRGTVPALITLQGGAIQGTYAVKELVYAYAMWISPKFHLHVIRAYDALITGARLVETPAMPAGCTHRADVMVSASRSFSALVRAGRTMGMHRGNAILAANVATRRITGVDLVDELGETTHLHAVSPVRAGTASTEPLAWVTTFHQAMQAGELPVPYIPCMSRDAFYVYQHWCTVNGHPPLTLPPFIHQLTHAQGIRCERKRYRAGGETYGPVGTLLWGYSKPAADTEPAYLGRMVSQFAEAGRQYMLATKSNQPPQEQAA